MKNQDWRLAEEKDDGGKTKEGNGGEEARPTREAKTEEQKKRRGRPRKETDEIRNGAAGGTKERERFEDYFVAGGGGRGRVVHSPRRDTEPPTAPAEWNKNDMRGAGEIADEQSARRETEPPTAPAEFDTRDTGEISDDDEENVGCRGDTDKEEKTNRSGNKLAEEVKQLREEKRSWEREKKELKASWAEEKKDMQKELNRLKKEKEKWTDWYEKLQEGIRKKGEEEQGTRNKATNEVEEKKKQTKDTTDRVERTGPTKMSKGELKYEMEERRNRMKNIVVKGGTRTSRRAAAEEIEKRCRRELEVKVIVEKTWILSDCVVMKLSNFRDKVEVMKRKRALKGTDIWIEDDLTEREKEIQRFVESIAEVRRKEGKETKVGHMKIGVEGRWFEWDESAMDLVQQKKKPFREE